ncbi:glycoside hydrolase family 64 [Trichoderma reesei QM6a]|uniref:Glycoside hydrolase family 64 n=2 Tax=Hypocrea jecorina TaxID=51453 RepID=G0RTS0_HYPJQ|nr:glycoside hydrolase family 64 [Trichoderma reesei QM6a]EGR45483.1 glycoside hydrolase family 64 [Trichoderma reesei QM6a]ETR98647.1 glucanase B [Trichoderma reesei RUT C-30]
MRTFTLLTALMGAVSAAPSLITRVATPFSVASPGGIDDISVTGNNILNGTYHSPATTGPNKFANQANPKSGHLPIKLVNSFGGGHVNAYIAGLDSENRVVFVKGDGSLLYPSSGGSEIPVPVSDEIKISLPAKGKSLTVTVPIVITSARIYFAEGTLPFFIVKIPTGDGLVQPSPANLKDPSAGINWGFVELSYTEGKAVWANISYVDFVGMILSMSLSSTDGSTQVTRGLHSYALGEICKDLAKQTAKDGFPWANLCIRNSEGRLLRALAPGDYSDIDKNGFKNYWKSYVDKVWDHYSSNTLTINTQSSAGKVECKVKDGKLQCDGDNRSYSKPSANDIWGCNSGPFAIKAGDNELHKAVVPRLCAAFVRATLLIPGGDVQPGVSRSKYYKTNPANHYSRLVHHYEVDGRGYAFPYDDVNPNDKENASGTLATGTPEKLTVYIGAPPP